MNMQKTKHAGKRQKQRGISDFIVKLIEYYGSYEAAPGGATRITLGHREYQMIAGEMKWYLQQLDKARRGTLVVKDDHLITCYK
jgi:hypothetical protein